MRVVVDTNVLVSRYLSPLGKPAQVFAQWEGGAFELAVSEAILAEYERALNYDKARRRHGLTPEQVHEIVEGVRILAIVVEPRQALAVVAADPDDNRFLECAVTARADYVVTGDRALLDVGAYAGVQMLSSSAFLAVLAP